MTLNEWQERLSAYFAGLRNTLDAAGNPRPIFALEHDLSSTELEELTVCLRDHTNSSGPAARHYHAWSVYAAEIGYRFKGDEYWQTFAEGLPNWKDADRDCIKDAFYGFKKAFRGAIPSGNWAKNFTIICWPITHALLPKDLQRHLANLLYDVRGAFNSEVLNNTAALGKLIAANSDGTSSRFRKFTEEHDLVGRIAMALLSPESQVAAELLAPHTLTRITRDLQAGQNAHAWLNAARQRASTVKLSGLKTRTTVLGFPLPGLAQTEFTALEQVQQERLELIIRQTGDGSWSVVGRMPNLTHIESSNASYQRVFSSQRSYIECSEKTHFAPRFFAVNRQDVVLKSWPTPGRAIVRFEPSPIGLSDLLDEICSLSKLSTALFRLRDDGTGIHVKSKLLRPSESYVFLSKEDSHSTLFDRQSSRILIDCKGVHGLLLDVPDRVSDHYRDAIKALGLDMALALQVRPSGYPARCWDGDGEVEWYVNSPKILAVTSTIEVKDLALNLLGNGLYQVIHARMDGFGPTFIDLEGLKAGQYQLHLAAQLGSVEERVVTGTAIITVVPDDDLVLNPQCAQGFTILGTPTLPTFEELWTGRAKINIYGPRGAQLRTELAFFPDTDGRKTALLISSVGKVVLPVDELDWSTLFDKVKKDKKVAAIQEDAVSCRLTWRSVDLGESSLHCEREFVPFRWSVRTKSTYHKVRLIQNDSTRELQLVKATFTRPTLFTPLVLSSKLDFEQSGEGGLFVARSESSAASVILTSPAHSGFGALKPPVETRIPPAKDGHSLLSLCEAFALWTGADIGDDPFLRLKRNAALGMVKSAVLESICGGPWTSAETGLDTGRIRIDNMCGMIGSARDYKFQRSVAETLSTSTSLTNDELATVVINLARSANLLRPATHGVSVEDLVGSFLSLFDKQDNDHSWMILSVPLCQFAMAEPDMMRLMRLFLLARQSVNGTRHTKMGITS